LNKEAGMIILHSPFDILNIEAMAFSVTTKMITILFST